MMILSNNTGSSSSLRESVPSPPLDFTLISDDEKRMMINFFSTSTAATPSTMTSSQFQIVTPAPTVLKLLESNSDESEGIECDFCKKAGLRSQFKGRFCSKICVGRFAQRYFIYIFFYI